MDLHPGPRQCQLVEVKRTELIPVQDALQENEDWYQDLVEHSHDLLCLHDLEGRLLAVNPAPARVLGYSVEELLQIPMRELIAPECRSPFDSYLTEIERVGEARGLLVVMTRRGERRVWEYYNTLRTEGVSSPIVRGIAHDVTEQKHREKLLRETGERLLSEARENERIIRELELFRTLVDNCNDAIEVVDPETLRFLDVNQKACSELGYSREELLSMGVFDIDPAVSESSVAKIKEELRKSGSLVMESIHRRKDGIVFPVEISMRQVGLKRSYVVAVSRDLTERKLAETRLRESQDSYRAIYERSPAGICWIQAQTGRFLGVNPKYCEIVGRTEEDLLSRDFQSITHPEDLPGNLEKLRQLAKGEVRHYELEKRYVRPDGSIRWVEIEVAAMWPEGADPIWHMAIVQDVTERKQAEERLREYERVVEGLDEMILVVDRDYRYVIANRAFLAYRGLKEEQVVEHRVEEVVHGAAAQSMVKDRLRECFEGKIVRYEMKYKYSKLGERDLLVSYFPIEGPSGVDRVACILQDITERKLAEEALRTSERRQHKITKQLEAERARLIEAQAVAKVGSWEAELPSLEITWSEQTHRIFETDPSHFHPTRPGFVEFIHPEDRVKVDAAFQASLDKAAPSNVEYRIVMADGRVKVLEEQWRVFHDEQGRPIRLMGTCRDVTERKRAEEALRRSEENYRHFVSQSSEGIFREDMDAPVPIDLPEDELVHHILYDHYLAECNDAMAAMYGLKSGKELRGKRLTEMLPPEDPHNIELTRDYIRSGFRILDRESHEVDIHGNPKVFLNSMIGTVENGMLVRTWGIQRDVTEKVKLEETLWKNVIHLRDTAEELRLAKEKLSEEKLYLEQTIDTELGFGEIVGRSQSLQEVMGKVAKVAPSDATVLLLGETGTGKELVARAIHRMSKRKDNSFVKVNCAAIPSGLLESELFGHEKGAFTGAVAKKVGRLELADRGTLFLDEIGEIPLDLQPKLLRVLQDQEFERLGGTQTLKVDFRLIAATNRELLSSVNRREFRSDLYYRLNVFPLRTPPLRERREDIPLLIEHFVRKYATRMNKSILSIPAKTMETLVQWAWPGNIRELENFVERSVILTPGGVLQVPLSELHAEPEPGETVTLRDKERDRILRALRDCHGQLGGPNGAAARLGLKRTTLQSKLNQLGINPGGYRA
ncbi:MAG TPA: PAS domain S-box protein [Candidatus Sulfotelmatobacter sp.]|jgi:PAS domain S-box-containing protein|nr:PAS domain S-box protein [Candidatus Sulfotelmatobacter sp.]